MHENERGERNLRSSKQLNLYVSRARALSTSLFLTLSPSLVMCARTPLPEDGSGRMATLIGRTSRMLRPSTLYVCVCA